MDYCTKNEEPNDLNFSKAEFGPIKNRTNGTIEDPNTENAQFLTVGFSYYY